MVNANDESGQGRQMIASLFLRGKRLQIALLAAVALVSILSTTISSRATGSFAPTVTMSPSTTQAGANPDLRVTVVNDSGEDLKNLTLQMPNGFFGSLNGADLCTLANAAAGACANSTKIGAVRAEAAVDSSTARLTGSVYLTDPVDSATEPAGLSVKIQAKIGGIDLGKVILQGRAKARSQTQGLGMNVIFTDIPRSIDSPSHGGVTSFHMTKVVMDLRSDLEAVAPKRPLLWNPTNCDSRPTAPFPGNDPWPVTAATSSYSGGATATTTSTYPVTDCDKLVFDPELQASLTDSTFGHNSGLDTTIDVARGASMRTLQLNLPGEIGYNFPALGSDSDMCPVGSISGNVFNPATCPSWAQLGTATATSPLLPDALSGEVYVISASPTPKIGLYVHGHGVGIGVIGSFGTPSIAPNFCDSACLQSQFTFPNIPDAPVTHIDVHIGNVVRTRPDLSVLSSLPLNITTVGPCASDITASFTSNAAVAPGGTGKMTAASVSPVDFSGSCTPNPISFTGPIGGETTITQPAFGISATGLTGTPSYLCALEDPYGPVDPNDGTQPDLRVPCDSGFTPATPLTSRLHRLWVDASGSGGGYASTNRQFSVEPAVTQDTTAPAPPSTAARPRPPATRRRHSPSAR